MDKNNGPIYGLGFGRQIGHHFTLILKVASLAAGAALASAARRRRAVRKALVAFWTGQSTYFEGHGDVVSRLIIRTYMGYGGY